MFNLSGSEIVFFLLIALVILGPDKLPDAMRKAGKAYGDFKRMTSGFQNEMKSVLDEPMRELRETAELAKGAATFDTKSITDTFTKPLSGTMAAVRDLGKPDSAKPTTETTQPATETTNSAPPADTASNKPASMQPTNPSALAPRNAPVASGAMAGSAPVVADGPASSSSGTSGPEPMVVPAATTAATTPNDQPAGPVVMPAAATSIVAPSAASTPGTTNGVQHHGDATARRMARVREAVVAAPVDTDHVVESAANTTDGAAVE